MSTVFVQKDFPFKTNIFELTDTGLKGQRKTLFGSTEFFVDYNNLGVRVLKTRSGSRKWLIGAGVFFTFFIAALFIETRAKSALGFHLIACLICLLIYLLTYKRNYFLVQPDNTNAVAFFYDKPTQLDLDNFITVIKERRNKTLCSQYGVINPMLPYQQNHSSLNWLLNNDALSREEYEQKIVELNLAFKNQSEKKIGF